MSTEKLTEIPIPKIIEGQQEKSTAFQAGWRLGSGDLTDEEMSLWRKRLEIPGGETLNSGNDIYRNNPLENAFCWGYHAFHASQRKALHQKSTEEQDHQPRGISDLTEIHGRMNRNPGFIPNWAFAPDDEDEWA